MDQEHRKSYEENTASWLTQLELLDKQYQQTVDNAPYDTLLFGDRFPFRYLTEDYGLSYYAAFSGCSAESEASFQTIAFLAQKLEELSLPVVLTLANPQTKIAETIVGITASRTQQILQMDSMQSVTASDVADGVSYLSVMEQNLQVLRQALGGGK